MICKSCGEEVLESEKYCSYCGESNLNFKKSDNDVNEKEQKEVIVEKRVVYEYHERKSTGNGLLALGIIGIIFGILFPLVTYCTSIPGLVIATQRPDKKGLILNIIAVIIAAINSIAALIIGQK